MQNQTARLQRSERQLWKDSLRPDLRQKTNYVDVGCIRCMAAVIVLRCIPEDDYAKLKAVATSFVWFIPNDRVQGAVGTFPITVQERRGKSTRPCAQILYLSPSLEDMDFEITLALVAHEIAHLTLGHVLSGKSTNKVHEDAAWNLACRWGFEREVKRWHAVFREGDRDGQVAY